MEFRLVLAAFMWNYILLNFTITVHAPNTIGRYPELYKVYKGCGFVKTCVKICLNAPSIDSSCGSCIKNRACPAIVTMRYDRGKFYSQMLIRQIPDQSMYISMGVAYQKSMLNSPYVACVYRPDKTDARRLVLYSGYTARDYTTVHYFDPSQPNRHIFYNKKIETIPVYSQPRPALYCEFSWKSAFSIDELEDYNQFNLSSDPYHIIAAIGSVGSNIVADWALSGHGHTDNGRVITANRQLLTKAETAEKDYDEDYDCEETHCGRGHSRKYCVTLTMFLFSTFYLN